MIDAPNLDDFYDLRVVFIGVLWFAVCLLVVSAFHRCQRTHDPAPMLFHLATHFAIAAEVFAIIFAASSHANTKGPSATIDPDEVGRMSNTFQWVQRASVLVWLVMSRWLFYFSPRRVVGFAIAAPVISEWSRISLQLLSGEDIAVVQLVTDCIVITSEVLSFMSVFSWKWLLLTDVQLLFRNLPEVHRHDDPEGDENDVPRVHSVVEYDHDPPTDRVRVADMLPLESEIATENAADEFRAIWRDESLARSIFARWKSTLALLAVIRLVFDALGLLPAYLLRVLVDNVSAAVSGSSDVRLSIVVVALLVASSLLGTFLRTHYNLKLQKIALYNRGLLSDCVTRHVLRTRNSVMFRSNDGNKSQGDIINHITVDTQRIADALGGLFDAWALPLQIAMTLYLLFVQVRFAFAAGLLITLALIPINMVLAKKIAAVNTMMLSHNDERVMRINEVISNIVYVKMCGWSSKIGKWITAPRQQYMRGLRWVKMLDAACVFFWATTPVFVSLATFSLFVAFGGELTAGRVVASLSLFNALILPLNAYPWVINGTVEAFVSLRRLEKFLKEFVRVEQRVRDCEKQRRPIPVFWPSPSDADENDDLSSSQSDDDSGSLSEQAHFLTGSKRRRAVRSATSWSQSRRERSIPSIFDSAVRAPRESDTPSRLAEVSDILIEVDKAKYGFLYLDLEGPIDAGVTLPDDTSPVPRLPPDTSRGLCVTVNRFVARRGQLVTIAGPAGSGKSTFLSALAGEVRRIEGHQAVARASIAFIEQTPFLFQGTIRANITCGAQYRKDHFDSVVKKCALDVDIANFELKEHTRLGDGGSGLSGGQKFRVAIARALYADKALYLIDDFMGCLDADVAAHIVDNVLINLAHNGKCVIVATHNIDLLHRSDCTYSMDRSGCLHLLDRDERRMFLERLNNGVPVSADASDGPQPTALNLSDVETENTDVRRLSTLEGNSVPSQVPVQLSEPSDSIRHGGQLSVPSDDPSESEVGLENKARGNIAWNSVLTYLRYVGWCMVFAVVFLIAAMQSARNLGDWFVTVWVSDSKSTTHELIQMFGILAAVNAVLAVARGVSFAYGGLIAAKRIHDDLLEAILRASYRFFTITSPGRIINRLSRDVYNIDDSLPFIVNILLAQTFLLVGSLVVIVSNSSWIVVALLAPILALNYIVQKPYRQATREVKRLESAARSPVIDELRRILDGGKVVRAMGSDTMNHFLKRGRSSLDVFLRANYNLTVLQAWFTLRLQLIGSLVLLVVGIVTIYDHSPAHAPALGLALAYVSPLTSYVSGLLSAVADTEKQLVSIERVMEYMKAESEAKAVTSTTTSLQLTGSVWPLFGTIQFNDVSLRYESDGPLILRNVTFHVEAGEKIAIVGRTGAGKTSLFVALLRMLKLHRGSISIDSEDICRVDPDELRQRLALFPQDPFIFHGTVRKNVDPFDMATDDEVAVALSRVQLGHISPSFVVEEGGKNLSCGQRYLLALARIMLQQSCVLLLDEPSAKIDRESDSLLWTLLDAHFKESTVIAITHNLSHIDWFDRVLVFDRGVLVNNATPSDFRRDRQGLFT